MKNEFQKHSKWFYLWIGIFIGIMINIVLPVKIKQNQNILYNNDKYKIEKINSDTSYDFSVIMLYVKRIR